MRRNFYGFTLLELMVAISIFSVVSLLSMGGLNNILTTQESSEKNMLRLVRLQMIFTIMSRELQQLSSRSVRDEYGAMINAVTNGTSDGFNGIEFTHHGRFTLHDDANLQRVAYYLEGDNLVKKKWSVLDRVEDSQGEKTILLNNVDELNFSFYSINGNNSGKWQNSPVDQAESQLIAIRVTIKTVDYNKVYRVFEVSQ